MKINLDLFNWIQNVTELCAVTWYDTGYIHTRHSVSHEYHVRRDSHDFHRNFFCARLLCLKYHVKCMIDGIHFMPVWHKLFSCEINTSVTYSCENFKYRKIYLRWSPIACVYWTNKKCSPAILNRVFLGGFLGVWRAANLLC